MRILFPVLFLLFAACTTELTIGGYSAGARPVAQVLSPTNGEVVGTNYCISFTATDADDTNCMVYLQIGNGPVSNYPGFVTNTIWLSNQEPGHPVLTVYARDSKGKYSQTNRITVAVSAPGLTEINAGSLAGVYEFNSTALGDLDRDGDPDLVLTGNTITNTRISIIYRNDGSGGFTEINPGSLTGMYYDSIALGDLDRDGDLDLILTGSPGSGGISEIYQNDGSGSFTKINTGSLMDVLASSIALGDLDGDGDLDLVLTGCNNSNVPTAEIYLNDGTGGFSSTNTGCLQGVFYSSIALGDLDGDGDLDLILTGDIESGYISKIHRNDGSGSFTEINAGNLAGVRAGSIALGDLDGDGDLDLILTGDTGSAYISKIYRNDGSGGFTEINAGDLTGVFASSIALGDLDGDGDLDLVLTGYYNSKIYVNNGNGAFTEINAGNLAGVHASSVALGDLDGDGDLDLVLSGFTGSEVVSKIYRNNWNRGGCAPYAVGK